MNFEQNIVNVSPAQALEYGCDMFQLYYPGTKVGFSVREGYWSMNAGAVLKSGQGDARWNGFLLGTYNPVSEKVAFFDCWECGGVELLGTTYRDRIMLMRTMQPYLFDWCTLVNSYRITDFQHVWAEKVESGLYPGVIFRKSRDPATAPRLMCIKMAGPETASSESKPSLKDLNNPVPNPAK